jgi:predicted secreted protein
MAVHHGKEGEVVIGGSAVGELTSFTLETTGDVVESTKMADAAKTFVAGRTSFSGTLEMHFDEADSVQTQFTAGSTLTFKLLPEGGSTGDRKFEGSGIVTGMSVNQPMDGIVARSVTFQGSGALTIGTE